MVPAHAPGTSYSLLLIEAGLTAIAIASAFLWPEYLSQRFSIVERLFRRVACRKRFAVVAVGATMLAVRVALLPLVPAPLPFTTDDFSFLLAADTFAHGRLTNPTPIMWTHLESIHITMQPSYMSMYFPGPGLVMAAGQVVFGHPWAGVLITAALMCAAICWMLQAWVPPTWALLGGLIAVLRVGLFCYWTNSFTGGATVSALGGALVLGALPRLIKTARFRYGMLLAVGIALLVLTRPYEGMLLCLPVAVVLIHWLFWGSNRPSPSILVRRAIAPMLLIAAVLAWLGYYDYRAFGNPRTLPYTLDRQQYAMVPYYVWQPPHLVQYRHAEMRRFYVESEAKGGYEKLHSLSGFVPQSLIKLNTALFFFAAMALFPPLVMFRRVALDRRVRFLVWCVPFWTAGMAIGVFLIPHYLAPFAAAAYALGLQGMRHLRVWRFEGKRVGMAIVQLLVVVFVLMAGLRTFARPLHLELPQGPISAWLCTWIGPGPYGAQRAAIEQELERLPGKHLAIVEYGATHEPGNEWVYNLSDLDGSRVLWARAMSPEEDAALMRYYKDRDVWLIRPDSREAIVQRYPTGYQVALAH